MRLPTEQVEAIKDTTPKCLAIRHKLSKSFSRRFRRESFHDDD